MTLDETHLIFENFLIDLPLLLLLVVPATIDGIVDRNAWDCITVELGL